MMTFCNCFVSDVSNFHLRNRSNLLFLQCNVIVTITISLLGVLYPKLKLAFFLCYLKIINTFSLKNNVCILKQIVQETEK